MTTAAPSAPAAPAAPAPSAASAPAPSAPAWGSGQGVGDFLKGTISDAPKPAPAAAPANPATPAAAAPSASGQPEAPVAAVPTPEPKPGETPASPEAPKPEAKLFAGRFKTPEELEVAYDHSGREARRLAKVVAETEAAKKLVAEESARFKTELENAKLLQQLGPEIAEPTEEEMNSWPPAKVAKYFDQKNQRATLKQKLEADQKSMTEKAAQDKKVRVDSIMGMHDAMLKDTAKFPRYQELLPVADELLDLEPGLQGLPNAPYVAWLAAYGYSALQRDSASNAKTRESEEAARIKAAAGAAGAGAPGGAPVALTPGSVPSGPAKPEPGSDAEHQAKILAAGRTLRRPLFTGV